jgi:hypothetical protein
VSTLFDREHPPRRHSYAADDDTVEISVPTIDVHDPDLTYDPAEADRGRLRLTLRARRLQAALLLAAYVPASLGSAWLGFLAFLRINFAVMAVMCGALAWLVPDTVRLARWLYQLGRRRAGRRPPPRLSRVKHLIPSVLAGAYAWLLADWLLHQ